MGINLSNTWLCVEKMDPQGHGFLVGFPLNQSEKGYPQNNKHPQYAFGAPATFPTHASSEWTTSEDRRPNDGPDCLNLLEPCFNVNIGVCPFRPRLLSLVFYWTSKGHPPVRAGSHFYFAAHPFWLSSGRQAWRELSRVPGQVCRVSSYQ